MYLLLFSHFCPLLHFFIYNKERNAVIVLFLPKPPLESIGHLKVNSHGKASHDWLGIMCITRKKAWATALQFPSAIHLQCFLKRAADSYSPVGLPVWVQSQPVQIFRKSKDIFPSPCILKVKLISIRKERMLEKLLWKGGQLTWIIRNKKIFFPWQYMFVLKYY